MTASATKRPSVLLLTLEYPPEIVGGAGTYAHQLAAGLSARGTQVRVVTFTSGRGHTERRDGVEIAAVPLRAATRLQVLRTPPGRWGEWFNRELLPFVERYLASSDDSPDVIQCIDWFTLQTALRLRQRLRCAVVTTVASLHQPFIDAGLRDGAEHVVEQERALYRQADAVVTVSQSMRSILTRQYQLEDERVRVVYNGLDPETDFEALSAAERATVRGLFAAPEEKLVVFAGRLVPDKGIRALFGGAERVCAAFPRVRYVLVGRGASPLATCQGISRYLAEFPGAKDRVVMLDMLPRRELFALYQVADLALVPSLYEPFGYAAVEAMAMGVPVVASAVGGLPEIIEPEVSGLLVPVHTPPGGKHAVDVEGFARAQLRILGDPELGGRLGRAGSARARERFGLSSMLDAMEDIYLHLVNHSPR